MVKLTGKERRVILEWLKVVIDNKHFAVQQCEAEKEHWRKIISATNELLNRQVDNKIVDINRQAVLKYENAYKLVEDIEIMEGITVKLHATETEE